MDTENNSNAITQADDLDAFSAAFFNGDEVSVVPDEIEEAPADEDADDTSPSDADDTKPEDTETDADPEDSKEGDDEPEEEVVEKPKKKTAAERIAEVVAERNAEREEKRQLLARLEALEASKVKTEDTPTPATANELAAPDPDARNEDGSLKYPLGEYDPLFLKDNVNYLFAEKQRELEAKTVQENTIQERVKLQSTWDAKLAEAEKTEEMADIREAGAVLISELQDTLDPQFGDFLATTIMSLDQGPEVFYFLASNPDVAKAIAKQDAIHATIALGGLNERIRFDKQTQETGNTKKPPRVSQAPEPPQTVNRGNTATFDVPDDTDDLDAFADKFYAKRR